MITLNTVKLNVPVSFGVYFHEVKDADDNLAYRGDTRIFRDDLYYPEVVDFLNNKYKNVPKVNVVMHACSDGEESYSFLSVLINRLKDKAAKFLPLRAKDIDLNHLKLAKRGVYNITNSEYELGNAYLKGDFYNYFEPIPSRGSNDPRLKYTKTVKVEHSLKSLVNFEQGDIVEDIKNMDLKNTVLFARNFWPYLSSDRIRELADLLSKKADSSFTLIIGDYDSAVADLLRNNGFVETLVENVFEKPRNSFHDYDVNKYLFRPLNIFNLDQ